MGGGDLREKRDMEIYDDEGMGLDYICGPHQYNHEGNGV